MGPLSASNAQKRYILIIVDGFTKYLIAVGLTNIFAHNVAQKLIDHLFTKFGSPHIITTDCGTQFTGQLFKDLGDIMGFEHRTSLPFHQAANGQVEREVQTARKMISGLLHDNRTSYSKLWNVLQQIVFAYNSSTNSSTKETPFYLAHGWDPILPIDHSLLIAQSDNLANARDISSYKQSLAQSIQLAWKLAEQKITESQERQKSQYDKRHKVNKEKSEIEIGELILRKKENYTKFSDRWDGPFRVIAHNLPNIVVEIHGKPIELHLSKVKRFKTSITLPLRPLYNPVKTSKPKVQDKNLEQSESESESIQLCKVQGNSKRETKVKPIMQDKNLENSASESDKSYECDGCALCHH